MLKTGTGRMVRLAILVAIIILMAFTPLGYLKAGLIEITFLLIPVVIGAIILGPAAGAFLGGVFGLTSFIQCFGMSPFGAALLAISPLSTFILCLVPRILCGWISGLIFRAIGKGANSGFISYAVSALSAALLNTILFMMGLILLFGSTDYIMGFRGELSILAFAAAFVGVNGLVEAIVCFAVGGSVSKALNHFIPSKAPGGAVTKTMGA